MASLAGSRARQLSPALRGGAALGRSGLEAALLRETSRPLRLTLTENRSVLLSFRRKTGVIHLRLHRMFLHAPIGGGARGGALAAAHEPQRGQRGAALHEREPAPRAPGAAAAPAPRHRRARARPAAGVRSPERALLRRRPARAPHLGPRQRARAARRPHLRQLRSRARASSASIPCSTAARCRSTSWRASSTTRCCITTWAASPTAPAAPSTTRASSARRRRAIPGTARRWPGRRTTCRTCCAPAPSSTAKRKAEAAARRRH